MKRRNTRGRARPLAARILALAGLAAPLHAAPTAEVLVIGSTPAGRPVEVVVLAEPGTDARGRTPGERPALLIVAGLQGHHLVGIDTARALADRLLAEHAALLADRTVYILAEANPEGADRFRARSPAAESGRAPQPADADRDGRTDEDPADDLNADGLITLMRVPAPNPRYGLAPTHLADPDDPRLMREPKPADGEAASHALLVEGIDNDGDGVFNEDGWGGASGGGVDLDTHFPTHWPEHADGAGLYPLQRPEARALVEWAQSRHNITAVLVYGLHDTLVTVPPAGKHGPEGKVATGIKEADKPYYEKVSESFKEITGIIKEPDSPDRAGSFLQWASADLGVFAFGTPVWVRPDLVEAEKNAGDEAEASEPEPTPDERVTADKAALAEMGVPPELIDFLHMSPEGRAAELEAFDSLPEAEQQSRMAVISRLPMEVQQRLMAAAQGNPDPAFPAAQERASPAGAEQAPKTPGSPKKKPPASPDARWLAWIDAERRGEGFVRWTPFEHPQLGPVEIGGFVPGVRLNPPPEMAAELADQQTRFVSGLLAMLPALEVDPPTVEPAGPGLWRVSVTLRNTGLLPTASASGVKTERLPGIIVAFDPEQTIKPEALVSGRRLVRVESIAGSGATARAEWLVAAPAGAEARLEIRSAVFGDSGFDVRLTETQGGDQ